MIALPSLLQKHTDGNEIVEVIGSTCKEGLQNLIQKYPRLTPYLFNENNELTQFINIYLNGKDIRYLKEDISLTPTDRIDILISMAGG